MSLPCERGPCALLGCGAPLPDHGERLAQPRDADGHRLRVDPARLRVTVTRVRASGTSEGLPGLVPAHCPS
eukprot:8212562-Lingulodinium_polyedra.AAC.1